MKLADLRRLIRENGQTTVPLWHFVNRDPQFPHDRKVRPNAPSLVVQTKEGEICVIRVRTMFSGPANRRLVAPRQRPLPPNPPIHPGDEPETESAKEPAESARAAIQ